MAAEDDRAELRVFELFTFVSAELQRITAGLLDRRKAVVSRQSELRTTRRLIGAA